MVSLSTLEKMMKAFVCPRCKRSLPRTNEFFQRETKGRDGLQGWCKRCKTEHQVEENLRNPNRLRAKASRRRAKKQGSGGSHSKADIKRLYKLQDGRCRYCDEEVGKVYHIDHVIPISKGGNDNSGNLAIACPTCNLEKGDKTLQEWKP